MTPDDQQNRAEGAIEAAMRAIVRLAAARGRDKSLCPSEAARRLHPVDWRTLLPAVRVAAAQLVAQGAIICTQRGRRVDPLDARGPVRLSLPPNSYGSRFDVRSLGRSESA